jgi:predicted permease
MNNFIFSLNATLPVFLVIMIGFGLRRIGLLTEEFVRVGDRLVFRVALPVMLFVEIASVDWKDSFDLKFFLFCAATACVSFAAIYGLAWLLLKDRAMIGTYTMVSFRGSAAVLGIAFVTNIYGSAGFAPLMIVAVVPFYNIFSVLALAISAKPVVPEGAAEEEAAEALQPAFSARKVLLEVITNPLIVAVVLAIPAAMLHLPAKSWLTIPFKSLSSIGNMATPLALLVLGAGFEHREAIAKIRPVLMASVTKLVLLPAVFVPAAVWMGFRDAQLLAIAVMLASPTTVACYIMAKNMRNDATLASGTVLFTTLFSSVTITAMVYILRTAGLI